jgi:NAD+ synthase (glutamine-hydrolysing)
LHYIGALQSCQTLPEAMEVLLFCLYQRSRHSTQQTESAAKALAKHLGAAFDVFEIDRVSDIYVHEIGKIIGRALDWAQDDVALQNIQARARGPSVWLLANLRGAILLTTSNRSEAAVGYATMDGDTCGGLSPLAGVGKSFLRDWLAWLEKEGPQGMGAIPELKTITGFAPTAELKPQQAGQTDERDLMPYALLDEIEWHAIGQKKGPVEVFDLLKKNHAELEKNQLIDHILRFFRLWSQNQWKRERYAPAFHIDDQSLDPKTWCRYPILSSGYHDELFELEKRRDQKR